MALNFPSSPSTGDIHNASNNLSYFFDGVKWTSQGSYNTGTINTIKLDSLTSSFNGSLTTFNLTSNSISVKPANAQSVMISLGGVIQEPTTAYTINSETGTITFASAPASGTAFFGIVYSRLPQSTTTVDDGAITNAKVNATAAIDQSKLNISDATTSASGYMSASDKTKLDGIETSATADQTNAEIRAAVEAATDSNVFTDADHTKLNGIEASATADQTAAEIRTLVESATDSNVFTDADHTKLNGIETSATADQTASEIVSLVAGQTIVPSNVTCAGDLNIGRIIYAQGAELTIADGAITVTGSFHSVDTQGDASTDDLNRINGAQDGYVLFLRAANNARTIVVKDNTAGDAGSTNIQINGDFSLTHVGDVLQLVYYSGHWREVGRSDNNA